MNKKKLQDALSHYRYPKCGVVAHVWDFEPKTILTWVKFKLDRIEVSMKTRYWYCSATEHIVFEVRGGQRLLGPGCPPPSSCLGSRTAKSRSSSTS